MRGVRGPLGGVALLLGLVVAAGADHKFRRTATVRDFRAAHPCPSTAKTTGPCPGWVVDHKYPLCAGGPDEVENMQWEPYGQSLVKDRIERELCRCRGEHS
jgi:hypothetical protein